MKIYRTFIRSLLFFAAAVSLTVCFFNEKVMARQNVCIVIDPGHGGNSTEGEKDLGASYNGVYEKEIDLITASAMYDELSQYPNITVYMTRTEDVHMELQERADFAESVEADMFISVHYNASVHHRFFGTEIFTSAYGEEYAKGYSLAQNIDRYWREAGNVSKGIKVRLGDHGDYYGVIRMCRKYGIPAMILEHGYLDNDKDFSRLGTREFWEYMGRLDGAAIADYYGLTKGHMADTINEDLITDIPEDHINNDDTPPEEVSLVIEGYDPLTRELIYTVSASEPDGVLMYYGLDTTELAEDEERGFQDLEVWDEGALSMKGTYSVPEGYEGTFTARVYNNYEKYTDTEPVRIPEDMFDSGSGDTASDDMIQVSGMNTEKNENEDQSGDVQSEAGTGIKEKTELYIICISVSVFLLVMIILFCVRPILRQRSRR